MTEKHCEGFNLPPSVSPGPPPSLWRNGCIQPLGPPGGTNSSRAHSALGTRPRKQNRYVQSTPRDVLTEIHDLVKPFKNCTCDFFFQEWWWEGSRLHTASPPLSRPLHEAVTKSVSISLHWLSKADRFFPFQKQSLGLRGNLITAERTATWKSSDWFLVPGSCTTLGKSRHLWDCF